MIFDEDRMFAEVRKTADPLAKELRDRVDDFMGELVKQYEQDGSFEEGRRDAGDVVSPALAAIVMVLAVTIGAWRDPASRTSELKVAMGWLNELVCRLSLSEDARDILESYKSRRG